MRAIFALLGTFFAGWLGWWLGAQLSLMLAVFLGAIGSGVGLYYGRRLFDDMLG
ncbi:MAG TPA: hypothetical protein VFH57_02755 [Gammaproteobacteria bacterium]|nr:hypothetical protein [Gammaproteobacteria bacterium]